MRTAVLLLALAPLASADKWAAFGEKEWKNGDRRIVINETGYRLFDREKLVAEGRLPQLPMDAYVLTKDLGAVLFERYAEIGHGDTLTLLGADGQLRYRLTLEQAIPGGSRGAASSISSIRWYRGWCVDEERGIVFLAATNGLLSAIDLKTGKAAKPSPDVLLRPFAFPWALDAALEALVETAPDGLREAAEKLLAEKGLPAVTRLRAAVAVEKCGGDAVTRKVWDAVFAKDVEVADRKGVVAFAGRHVADLALVEKAARRKDVGKEAVKALGARGAARELAGVVTADKVETVVRDEAAELLRAQPAAAVVEAIDKEMEDATAVDGGVLLDAAIATKAPDLAKRVQRHEALLLKILEQESADVAWLADYFRGRPTSEAVRPLVNALARHGDDKWLSAKLIAALKPCSGQDFGADPRDWIKGLGAGQ